MFFFVDESMGSMNEMLHDDLPLDDGYLHLSSCLRTRAIERAASLEARQGVWAGVARWEGGVLTTRAARRDAQRGRWACRKFGLRLTLVAACCVLI